ncbi:HTH domain-containing protein [Periweissella fabalis]|uniref:HTH domain-containing protein n=1 Tax=Periweissella fabalis TaxID=1070421 RepID=A0A7X6N4Q2_9LACO|nr:HTH domain-containing protein [Periweissella fabalis]MCM0598457.1 HTH domain-containing protein [Periweissella fabalis]NKZ25005.1 HTH domain-containing protein [Periweissella fabalis]
MSENFKTIRELAEELDVSKQAIQYHIKSLTNKTRQTNDKGIVVLSLEEQQFIRSKVDKRTNKTKTNKQTNDKQTDKETNWDIHNYLISELDGVTKNRDKQLAVKDKQLENKDSQIAQMQNLLDQQQRLALQDKKLLEEYKAENDRLKVLKMPSQETESKHLDNQYKGEVNALKEKLEKLQEQIKDQKRIEEREKPRKWWGLWRK